MDISLCHISLPPFFSPLFLDGVSFYLSMLDIAASQPIFCCFAGWGVVRPHGPAAPADAVWSQQQLLRGADAAVFDSLTTRNPFLARSWMDLRSCGYGRE